MAHKTLIDIKGYEGLYAVTPDGRVWSYRSNRWLTPRKDNVGYYSVCLCRDGDEKNTLVHRLVAQAFIPNPNDYPCINHINEDKGDNRAENLEWCTHSYNNAYNGKAKRVALNRDDTNRIKASVEVCSKPVLCVELGQIFKSASEAARKLSVQRPRITDCCNGKRKTTGGYHWMFAEVSV
jgi:hypothetical protein